MNRIKTSIITLLLCCIVIIGSVRPVHCGLTGLFAQWIGDDVQSMANEMLEGLGSLLSTAGYEIGDTLVTGVTHSFGPDLDTFYQVLGGTNLVSGKNSSNVKNSDLTGMHKMQNIGAVFGFTVAIFIFGFSLFLFFFAEPGSIKDTPFRLVIRFAIAMFLIWNAAPVMDFFLDSADTIWRDYVMSTEIAGESTSLSFDDLLVGYASDKKGGSAAGNKNALPYETTSADGALISLAILGEVFGGMWTTASPIAAFGLVFLIIVSWPLIKGFFKFYIEIIERYLVVVVLYVFFGAAAGTVVSKNSSRIMWSYMQMFAGQIFILFANVAFMAVFIDTLTRGGFTSSIPNYIFGLAYLRICQKLDSYMAMLGLNVAQTGGQTMDCIAGVARNMVGAAKSAARGVQNSARVGSSQALAAGNYKMAAGLNAITGIQGLSQVAAAGGIRNDGLTKAGLDMAAKAGKKVSVDSNTAANVMRNYVSNPANQNNRNRVNALNADSQAAGISAMLNEAGFNVKGISSVDTSDMMRGTIKFSGTTIDGNEIQGKLSSRNEPGTHQIGKNSYLSTENTLSSTPNKIVKGNAESLGLASGTGAQLSNADKSFTDRIHGMSYNPDTNSFNLYNKANQQIGTITNTKDGHSNVVQAMNAGAGKNGSERILSNGKVNKNIEKANGFVEGSLEWDANKSSAAKGRYIGHAKAENEYGEIKDVDVVGFDIGKNSDKVGSRGGTMTTLDEDMHQLLIARRLQKALDTEAAGSDT